MNSVVRAYMLGLCSTIGSSAASRARPLKWIEDMGRNSIKVLACASLTASRNTRCHSLIKWRACVTITVWVERYEGSLAC